MQSTLRLGAGACALALVASAGYASEDLETRIAELEARNAASQDVIAGLQEEMRAMRSGGDWMTEQRETEMRGLVQDVLDDADTRSSLLQNSMNAGWDNGFFLQSSDGNFKLRLMGQIQFRYVWGSQNNAPNGDNYQSGFENTRTRIGVKGHIVDPSWQYFIWTGWNANGGGFLLDAWIMKDLGNGWKIQAGQFKLPNWQEWVMSETKMMFVERSLLDARYSSLYSQGVMGHYDTDDWRLHVAFSDGIRNGNTPWNNPPGTATNAAPYQGSTEFALTARFEYKFAGNWSQYGTYNSPPGDEAMHVVGASIHYQRGESGTSDPESEVTQYSIDYLGKFGGWSIYAAGIGMHVDSSATGAQARDELGFLVQGGYYINDDWQLIGRYEWGDLDGAAAVAGNDDLSIISVGATRFWSGHNLKWTTDIGFALDSVDANWGGTGRGWRGDALDEDGQVVIRSQINIVF